MQLDGVTLQLLLPTSGRTLKHRRSNKRRRGSRRNLIRRLPQIVRRPTAISDLDADKELLLEAGERGRLVLFGRAHLGLGVLHHLPPPSNAYFLGLAGFSFRRGFFPHPLYFAQTVAAVIRGAAGRHRSPSRFGISLEDAELFLETKLLFFVSH